MTRKLHVGLVCFWCGGGAGFCANSLQRSSPAFSCVVISQKRTRIMSGWFSNRAFRATKYRFKL